MPMRAAGGRRHARRGARGTAARSRRAAIRRAISFAFVDPTTAARAVRRAAEAIELANPIAADLAVMRMLAVAGTDSRGARESASPAAAGATVRDRRSFRARSRRDRRWGCGRCQWQLSRAEDARGPGARLAPAGAVGECGDAGGFLRRQGRRRRSAGLGGRAGGVQLSSPERAACLHPIECAHRA